MQRTKWIWISLAAVLLVVGVGTALLVSGSDDDGDDAADRLGDCPSASRQVLVSFRNSSGAPADAKMRKATPALQRDPEVEAIRVENQQANFEAFKKYFADQPELARLARVGAMPATIWLRPADGVDQQALAARLRDELTDADEVDTTPCDDPPAPATSTTR